MADYELTFQAVSIPSGAGGASVTIEEDNTGDGTPDVTETVALSDGVTSYTTSSGAFAGSGQVRLSWSIGPPSDVTTTGATVVPADVTLAQTPTPQNLRRVDITSAPSVELAWDSVPAADEYRIYRATSPGTTLGDYTQIDTTPTTGYTDTTVSLNSEYYYVITAYNNSTGESSPSNEVYADVSRVLRRSRTWDTTTEWNTGTYSQTTESGGSVQLAEAPSTFDYSIGGESATAELRDADTGTVLYSDSVTNNAASGSWTVDTFQHPNLEAYVATNDSDTRFSTNAEILKPDGSVFAAVSTTESGTGSPSETATDTFGYYETGSYTTAEWTPNGIGTPTLSLLEADVTYSNPSQEITATISNGTTSTQITLSGGVNTYSVDLPAADSYSLSLAFTRGTTGNETPEINSLSLHAFNEPLNTTAVNTSGRDNDLSWDALTGSSGYRVYRSENTGTSLGDYTQIADVTTPSYTDAAPLDGTQYHYVVTGYDSVGESPPSVEDTATTVLPDEDLPLIRTNVEDELTVDRETQTANAGNVRVQIRETGETAWDSSAVGFAEQVIPYDDLNATFTGLEDGEKYDIRARTETQDVIGEYVMLTAITLLPVPSNVRISDVGRTSLDVTWVDESDNEDGFRVQIREPGGTYATDTTTNPNTEAATLSSLSEDTTYEIRVVAYTEHVVAESQSVTSTTITGSYSITVDSPVNQNVAGYGDTSSFGLDLRYNASHTATIQIPENAQDAGDLRLGDTEITYRSETLLQGTVLQSRPLDGPMAELEVEGPAWHLKRQGPDGTQVPVGYSNLPVADAVREYATLRGLDVTVYDPPVEIQVDDEISLDSNLLTFPSVFPDIPSTAPFVVETDRIRTARTTYIAAGSNLNSTGTLDSDNVGASNFHISNEYYMLDVDGQFANTTITPEYDIPADRVGVAASVVVSGSGAGSVPLRFNQNEISSSVIGDGANPGGDWLVFEDRYTGSDLTAGSDYIIQLDLNSSDFSVEVDALLIYDTAHPPTNWEEPQSLNDTIAGPEWYPSSATAAVQDQSQTWNITDVRVDATVNNTANAYEYAFSIDGGQSTTTVSNQADANVGFKAQDEYGTVLSTDVTLSSFGDGNPDPAGPKPVNRNTPQEITQFDIYITTDNTPIISSIELDGNDFENLRNLVESGGMRFVTDPTQATPSLEVFSPDDPSVAKNLDTVDLITEPQASYNLTGYANQARATNPDTGETQTVRDFGEADQYGVIEAPPVYPSLSGEALKIRAQQEVIKRSNNDQPETSIRAMPQLVLPGYPYEFDFGLAALDNVRYSVSAPDSADMTLEFGQPDTPVQRLIETRRNIQE